MRKNNIFKHIKGTEGCAIIRELGKSANDLYIIKKRYSAFYNTDLEKALKANNIDTLILAGINTHACIRMAAVDAYQRDYEVILAKDCIESYDKSFHDESIRYLTRYISKAFDNNDIKKLL